MRIQRSLIDIALKHLILLRIVLALKHRIKFIARLVGTNGCHQIAERRFKIGVLAFGHG